MGSTVCRRNSKYHIMTYKGCTSKLRHWTMQEPSVSHTIRLNSGKPHKISSLSSLHFKLKLIPFGLANIGDYFHVFRCTFILSKVRLGWVKDRIGYHITPHHYSHYRLQ